MLLGFGFSLEEGVEEVMFGVTGLGELGVLDREVC